MAKENQKDTMKEKLKKDAQGALHRFFSDYTFKTLVSAFGSTVARLIFTIYNIVLYVFYKSPWNLSISIYYAILIGLWTFLSFMVPKRKMVQGIRQMVFFVMVLMNLSLIAPLAIMVMGERSYRWGLIPAIGIAAYTFFRITLSIVHIFKSHHAENPYIREIRALNLMDSLVSILILQNTLVSAVSGEVTEDIHLFVGVSSGVIWLLLLGVTYRSYKSSC